jgi:hypothetical protein
MMNPPVVGDDGLGEGSLEARLVDRLAAPVELDALPQAVQAHVSHLRLDRTISRVVPILNRETRMLLGYIVCTCTPITTIKFTYE